MTVLPVDRTCRQLDSLLHAHNDNSIPVLPERSSGAAVPVAMFDPAHQGRATEELQLNSKTFSAGFLAVTTTVLAAVALPGQAYAADPPKCQAPQGNSCIGIKNHISDVLSIRVNGACITGIGHSGGRARTPNPQRFLPDRLNTISVEPSWNNECGAVLPPERYTFNVSYADKFNYVWVTVKKR
ncbi:hypothetical protein [Amycolatopsis sp. NPDC059657]|uniref:hypothetical protein n=1 Tax=Amycolatopsis sp. NPDC059657 TaxID=3346899 RepID=UPI0036734040